jgi:hypothetical protein
MAKTNRTNPHGEPTRRSNRTAGKSPMSNLPAAHKLPATRKPAAARKATAAAASPSHGDSKKFSDDINEEDRRIENRDSKTRILTGRRWGNLIKGGPVAPNYKLMSASKASEARSE